MMPEQVAVVAWRYHARQKVDARQKSAANLFHLEFMTSWRSCASPVLANALCVAAGSLQ